MIQYGRQKIDAQDIENVVKCLQSDWLTTGPLVDLFEKQIEQVTGSPAVSVTSGTRIKFWGKNNFCRCFS